MKKHPAIKPITEKAFLSQVVRLAGMLGWMCYHTMFSWRSQGGFPDLVMVRRRRVVYAELKSDKGSPTADQVAWLEALRDAGQAAFLWRPSQWDEIVAELRKEV